MTQKPRQAQANAKTAAALPVVLFGLDQRGKPTAAWFAESQAALAAKAATQLRLRVLTVANPAVAELAAKLPPGRIHASGKGLVSTIRTDLYGKLLAAAAAGSQPAQPSLPPPGGPQSNGGSPKSKGPTQDRLPKDWDAIGPGHLVLAQQGLEDGWYDAVVVEQNGDMLTLRWRDPPRERRFTRHRRSLGLLFPGASEPAANAGAIAGPQLTKPAEEKASAKPKKGLPLTWGDIEIDHLVLAKDDSPCQSWWEAIPTEKHGDKFTLRWRDYAELPTIVRPRLNLALLCPSAK
jgi:hypothetical protein